MKLVNVKFDTIDDVLYAVESVGKAIGENQKALVLKNHLTSQLNQVRKLAANQPTVRVLMMMDTTGHALVSENNFLDELLRLAGGENVVRNMGPWPMGDLELLLQLEPDLILCLAPDGPADLPSQIKKNLSKVHRIPAISNGRVYAITGHSVLLPGAHIGQTAQSMQEILQKYHPTPAH